MKKRMLAVLLTLVLVLTMIPGTASAFATEAAADQAAADGAEVRYSTDGGTTWKEDSLMNALWGSYTSENVQIELLRDITLDSSWYAQQDLGYNGNTVVLDGKGYTIQRTQGAKMLFCVRYGSDVTLKDITIDGGAVWEGNDPESRTNTGLSLEGYNAHLIYVDGGATLTLDSGTTLQNSDLGASVYGAAVVVGGSDEGNGKLIMKDGVTIKDNRTESGGAVCVMNSGDVFEMRGGTISGNYAASGGGGVLVNGGEFEMTGGEISGNGSGNNGGGVCVNGTFTMNDGKIENNKSAAGGGGITALSGTVKLNGGSVSGNSITGSMGGGVLVHNGSLTVSGAPTVIGNTAKDSAVSNVYLSAGKTITVSTALTEGASVGVTTKTAPTETIPVNVTGSNSADYSSYFTSDNNLYGIKNNNNTVQLVAKEFITVTFNKNDGSSESETKEQKTLAVGFAGKLDANSFAREGYVFKGWNTVADGSGSSYIDKAEVTLSSNTTLYAQWIKVEHTTDPAKNALQGDILMSDSEVIEMVEFTEEEKSRGEDMKVFLKITDISESVPVEDKNLIMGIAGTDTVAAYLDVTLFKQIGNGEPQEVTGAKGKIKISLAIPDAYINNDSSKTRTYYIIYVHDDNVDKINGSFDSASKVYTYETNQFSTYALAYYDTAVTTPPEPSGGGYVPVVIEKPVIEADEGAAVSLGILGTTAEIKVKEGFELADVTVNGVSVGIVERLTGLKTGDKVVVTTKAIETEPTDAERIAALEDFKLVARSRMTELRGDKAVRVHWYDKNGADLDAFGFDGYEVWRSLKRYEGYSKKPFFTTEKTHYYNNLIEEGNKYYYKVRGYILVDGEKYYTDWSLKAWRTVK